MANVHLWFGYLAGALAALAYLVYIVDIFRLGTRPQRATWLIWSVVSILLLVGLLAKGEQQMIWVPWAFAGGSSVIFLISLWRGVGGWEKLDRICLGGAALSLVVWGLLGTPVVPILINLFVDLMGAIPTVKKVWRDPKSERNFGWIIFTAASTANLFAVKDWDIANGAYVVYMAVCTWLIVYLAYRRKGTQ